MIESIGSTIQLHSSIEVILVLFLNCCESRIKVNNSRQLLVILFTFVIVEFSVCCPRGFFVYMGGIFTLNLGSYLIISCI